jgi:hypothetical protein
MANLGDIAVRITADPSSFEAGLAKSAQSGEAFAQKLSGSFGNLGNNVLSTFTAIAAHPVGLLVTSLTALSGVLVDLAQKAEKLAIGQAGLQNRFGLTNVQAAGLQLQARMTGVSMEDLNSGLRAVSRHFGEMSQAGGRAEAGLNRLGLSARELTLIPISQAIALVGDRLMTIENRYERAALANEILTRRGVQLEAIMRQGTAGMDAAANSAERLGLALGDTAQVLARQQRMFTAFRAVTENEGVGLGATIMRGWNFVRLGAEGVWTFLTQGAEGVADLIESAQRHAAAAEAAEASNRSQENIDRISDAIGRLNRNATTAGLNRFQQAMADLAVMPGINAGELERGFEAINAWQEAASRAFGQNMGRDIEMLGRHIDGYVWGTHDAALQTAVLRGEIQDTNDASLLWQARLQDSLTTVNQLLERSVTPAQRLRNSYDQLALAFRQGAITAEQFTIAATQAELANAGGETRLAAGIVAGSSAAISMRNQAMADASGGSAGAQQRAERHLADLVRQGENLPRLFADAIRAVLEMGGGMGQNQVAALP